MSIQIALLRGINVGGKNKLPMKELAALFAKAGCTDVRTFIASGNVVFRAPAAIAEKIPTMIAKAIAAKFSLTVPVVTRSAEELRSAVAKNPFARAEENELALAFLAAAPSKAQIAALDPKRSPPDEFAVIGREVYLRLPNGFAKTKITNAWLDSKLGTVSTMRNWRTVQKLVELSAAQE